MTITYHAGRRIQGLSNDIVETPTLDDNFTTNTGWVMNDATAVTISGGKLNASFSGDGTNDSVAYNLGFVAGSKWILDYEFNITSFVRGNNVGSYYIVALSNLNQTANYNATLQNAMWAIHGCHPYAPYADDIWLGKSVNQSLDITQDGEIGAGITATGGAFPPWLTGTPYYARFIRLSDTSYSFGLYTNPERTTLVEDTSVFTGTLVADSLTNLQYIVIRNYNGDVAGSINITFDNFKFYNGVSSLTSKPTNVQAGSRFEETDTRKIYNNGFLPISTTGLKAYYKFEEESGNLINQAIVANGYADGLGSSADGTNTSVTYSSAGKIGNSYLYTKGTSRTILGSSLSQFNFIHNTSQLFSISLWYKLSGALENVIGIFGDGEDNTAKVGISSYFTANGTLAFNTTNGAGQDALTTPSGIIPNNTNWHHLVLTYDRSLGSGNIKTFIDGTLVATTNKDGSFVPSNSNSSNAMGLGCYPNLAQSMKGNLDEFSIWNRILTSAEITSLYNNGISTGWSVEA